MRHEIVSKNPDISIPEWQCGYLRSCMGAVCIRLDKDLCSFRCSVSECIFNDKTFQEHKTGENSVCKGTETAFSE